MENEKKKPRGKITPNDKVRIAPRIPRKLSILCKYIYSFKGVTLEERIEYLIKKDVENIMNQKWFKDALNSNNETKSEFDFFLSMYNPTIKSTGKLAVLDTDGEE